MRAALTLVVMLLLTGSRLVLAEPDCLSCHTRSSDVAVHAIFQTAHARATSGSDSCINCHGASEQHLANPSAQAPERSFGPRWTMTPPDANSVCLECHQGQEQMFWLGSAHEQEELACTDCHQLHVSRDPALIEDEALNQCLSCHTRQQAELRLPSRHPILEGKTGCSDCHNPHGSSTDAGLHQATLNDNCYSCHAETRGPHLWPHAPVDEDCSYCHVPHGSVNQRLLSARTPFLCQQCHSAAFHPSQLNSGSAAGSGSSNQYLLGKNCLNCHSNVHGSNHPGGARLAR